MSDAPETNAGEAPEPEVSASEVVERGLADFSAVSWPMALRMQLEAYVSLLLRTNRVVNLVSRRNTPAHVERFVRESLFLATLLQSEVERAAGGFEPRLLDLGSGGGFPGIVLRLALPAAHVQLLEATRKKARFLADVAEALGLERLRVTWGRSEELVRAGVEPSFDWVTGKGLGTLAASTQLAAPFLVAGGIHWTFKGAQCMAELEAAGGVFRQRGFAPYAVERIPGSEESYVVGVSKLSRAASSPRP